MRWLTDFPSMIDTRLLTRSALLRLARQTATAGAAVLSLSLAFIVAHFILGSASSEPAVFLIAFAGSLYLALTLFSMAVYLTIRGALRSNSYRPPSGAVLEELIRRERRWPALRLLNLALGTLLSAIGVYVLLVGWDLPGTRRYGAIIVALGLLIFAPGIFTSYWLRR